MAGGPAEGYVPIVALRRVTLCTALALAVASCTSDDPEAATTTESGDPTTTTTTVPERPASTTTTAFDPATVEGEVEAAYLRSWDVYADAVYTLQLDETALASVYAGEHLATKRNEIRGRIDDQRAASVHIEHDYSIDVVDESTAIVIDRYRNHQVLIDPSTREPIEDDPDELVVDAVTLRLTSGGWRVALKERIGE
jgi:hypothetical protein